MFHTRLTRSLSGAAAGLALLLSGVPAAESASEDAGGPSPSGVSTQNPISSPFSDTYADPAVIRGKDGYWYMYATSDPLTEAPSEFGLMHVARTRDFDEWEYLGTIFDEEDGAARRPSEERARDRARPGARPDWATSGSFFWAPDIRYVDGQYMLYYTVTDTVADPGAWNYAIGVATAPTPAGPWTDSGGAVVEPRPDGNGNYLNTIDPALLADDDGKRYLYFGGFHGGIWVTELDETGTRAVGEPTQVAHSDRYEGAFVVKRGGYYYLTASSANCCAGPVTGYSVYAGRSTSPRGPFVDHEGVPMTDSRVGGTQVLAQNGNRWIGVGHHSIATDVSGQDYIFYHGIDRGDAWLDQPGGVNERPALVDRLDWISKGGDGPGWPVARAGAGPSDTPQPAPVTQSELSIDSADPASGDALRAVSGQWTAGTDTTGDSGDLARLVPDASGTAAAATTGAAPADVRVEADVRGDGAFTVELAGAGRNVIDVTVDPQAGRLSVEHRLGRDVTGDTATLPDRFDPSVWTSLAVEVRDGRLHARLAESRLGDVDAEVSLDLPHGASRPRPVRLVARGGEAQVDNLTVVEAHTPVTERVPEPAAAGELFADEFDGGLADGWNWGRRDGAVEVRDGGLNWPLTSDDLVGAGNTGALLLRTPPEGDWIAETKLHLDLGTDTVRNYQQAGMIVHVNDDHFLRLGDVAIWGTRQVEFGKEIDENGTLRWGGHLGGPVAETMWLRLSHTVDPATGEHRYRSATSRDGDTWRWGATWTLPAGTEPRLGLYAGGGAQPATVATFDYLRIHARE
ncbi:glycosyl hydrolase family 43 [Haloactinopolyspora alba]|uniref:Glycosyl hydrolase family 43 n=1 Tax=Haloactinopolyspora alba TaxID=648780 RepID=A0A2P8D243_9ACTN|nr:family 43 glycosylhydrolase [Haloactinopolyspora alba]PSK91269.1 glycosyl hydrolase family 43 [Haloactinopolyspora alba]